MGFPLLEHNKLIRKDSNVWVLDTENDFDYSDGDTAEEYLKDVMINSKDLSSQSLELEDKIVDWASEYHLSSQRANLLRGLNLDGIGNVLEMGCGCGAITRYLGELGINVDAVEGNLRRAEITRLRCRDLENVNVINANFNDLTIPKGEYDAVFLIGVLEYASRFSPAAKDDKDAVVKVLSDARSALRKEGVLFTSIENRMGLKYWMGASEDHYSQPHVGLYGYPQNQGIKTYDKRGWEGILKKAGIKCFRFCYPFPDYKLPRVVLSDEFIKSDEYAHSILYRISSRDYVKDWQPDVNEFLLWESLHQSGYLEEFANSFFIIISESMQRLNKVIPYDFVHFSDYERKPLYKTVTVKPQDIGYIVKKKMTSIEVEKGDEFIKQNLSRSKYIKGPLLSSLWLHSLVGSDDTIRFEKLVREYYHSLLKYFNKREESEDTFDLLPLNIIVDDTGSYQAMDKEWIITARMSPEYVLFRALLWFSYNNKGLVTRIYEKKDIANMKEFIEHVFSLFSFQLDQELDQFIELEERVQREVVFQRGPNPVRSMLMEPFQHAAMALQSTSFLAQLFWAGENEVFCEENSVTESAPLGTERQVLMFKLPRSARNVRHLRIDPAGRPGFFHLFKVSLKRFDLAGTQGELLWELRGAQDIAENSQMEGIHYCKAALGEVFLSTMDDPQIIFELPETVTVNAREGILQVEVEIDWPKSADYLIAKDALGKKIALQKQQIQEQIQQIQAKDGVIQEQIQQVQAKDGVIQEQIQQVQAKDGVIQEQVQQIQAKDGVIQEQIQQIKYKDTHIHNIEYELKLIKASKVWRLAESFRRLFYLKLLGRFPSLHKQALTISREGFRPFFGIARSKLTGKKDVTALVLQESDYNKWIKKNELTEEKITKIKEEVTQFEYNPKISIIMPVYDVHQIWLEKAINSVLNQLYENWELCIADDASTKKHIKETLERYSKKDSRIRITFLEENQGISVASNEALSLATGDFIGLLDNDDELTAGALYENVKILNKNPEADLIYSDEDKIDTHGNRMEPFFKPDYSPDFLLTNNYICHFSLFRRSIINHIGGFKKRYEGSQDYDLILRFIENTKPEKIFHIPKILYHWRKIPGSAAAIADAKNYAFISARKALSDYLTRNKIKGEVVDGNFLGSYRVRREITNSHRVSIIIPFKDKSEFLKKCVNSILKRTEYEEYEIVLIDNQSEKEETFKYLDKIKENSGFRVLDFNKPFNFSAINNYAISKIDSEYLILMNNDIEVISPDWIESMLEFAQRKDVGAVGALLYYPNNTVQHAGIILGIKGIAGHSHLGVNKDSMGYFGRLKTIQNLSAVTAACLMTKKTIYNEVGGFDENYSHAFNDVDFCLKIRERGYMIVYTPYAELYHHESLSRGYEDTQEKQERFKEEIEYFKEKWSEILANGDPYYNPNLTLDREDFSIRI